APNLPDLIILNLVLPDADGLVLCQQLKARPEVGDVPVIVCSARDRTVDRVVALDYGADDFISKPFEVAEVQARVRAVLRRTWRSRRAPASARARAASGQGQHQVGQLCVDTRRRQVTLSGTPVPLSPTEYK